MKTALVFGASGQLGAPLLERLNDAAPAALLVITVGLCAVALLARTNRP